MKNWSWGNKSSVCDQQIACDKQKQKWADRNNPGEKVSSENYMNYSEWLKQF